MKPAFILHTGDITQLSKPSELDDADQILKEAGLPTFHVPGEHDMLDEGQGKACLDRGGLSLPRLGGGSGYAMEHWSTGAPAGSATGRCRMPRDGVLKDFRRAYEGKAG